MSVVVRRCYLFLAILQRLIFILPLMVFVSKPAMKDLSMSLLKSLAFELNIF
jgi:hypothetical protein